MVTASLTAIPAIANTDIIVFAKAPQSGFAKTRLIPALGASGAAQLALTMLNHAVGEAVKSQLGAVVIATTPIQHHPAFIALANQFALDLIDQGSGDLGQRMQSAFDWIWQKDSLGLKDTAATATSSAAKTVTKQSKQILLMGSDIPAIDSTMLRKAAYALQSHDAVFIPTFDGGYALVGLKAPQPDLLLNMQWSNPAVMQTTRARADALGLKYHELALVHDIDDPADLKHCPF